MAGNTKNQWIAVLCVIFGLCLIFGSVYTFRISAEKAMTYGRKTAKSLQRSREKNTATTRFIFTALPPRILPTIRIFPTPEKIYII